MNNMSWKCYRCDLIFKVESHAILHKDISNHNVTKINLISA